MVAVVIKYDSKKQQLETRARRITIQVNISDDFLHRIARLYKLKYNMKVERCLGPHYQEYTER
jgi:hypothetical protein